MIFKPAKMSLYNELNLESAMDDGASKYMLDGNELNNFSTKSLEMHTI